MKDNRKRTYVSLVIAPFAPNELSASTDYDHRSLLLTFNETLAEQVEPLSCINLDVKGRFPWHAHLIV